MSIGVLDKSGLLKELAVFLNDNLPNQDIIATVIGIASALIDNVPLVAATMGMYDLSEYGTDDKLWQLIALCAGTGVFDTCHRLGERRGAQKRRPCFVLDLSLLTSTTKNKKTLAK